MDARSTLVDLRSYVERKNFRGYDPFDALNSPLLMALAGRRKSFRIAFIQALKRCPVNLRPVLGIRKGLNPKALGLFLWGEARLHAAGRNPSGLERIETLRGLLDRVKSLGFSGNCWGYNFDWQSRAFFLPKGTPTLVNTSFIGRAFIGTYETLGDGECLRIARSCCDFILKDLNRLEEGETTCFSYSPMDRYFVHNATALAASLLAMTYKHTWETELAHIAKRSMGYVACHQRPDGTWPYGEDDIARKTGTDSFHTGFILESLKAYAEGTGDGTFTGIMKKGLEIYQEKFFLRNGAPKYFPERAFPFDIHSASQAILTLCALKDEGADQSLCRKIMNWMIENLRDRSGYFYYQKTKCLTNRIPFMRWSQAWAFLALATYLQKND